MKGRESGMPETDFWQSFFDAEQLLTILIPQNTEGIVVEFGSGYGTFTIPAARLFSAQIIGLDIENELINQVRENAHNQGIHNIELRCRDFVENGTGLEDNSVNHVMLYNILHIEHPQGLLTEAFRILAPGGTLSVIHWRADIKTPRGPSLDIRPTPDQCIGWAQATGFSQPDVRNISNAAPYHFGLLLTKPFNSTMEKL